MNSFFKYTTVIGLVLLTAFISHSQVEISFEGVIVSSGSTNTFDVSSFNASDFFSMEFRNTSGETKNYTVRRKRIVYPSSWNSQATKWGSTTDPFGGFCYPGNQDLIWTTYQSIPAANNEAVRLEDYYIISNDSCAHLRYYIISEEDGIEDSIDVLGCATVNVDEVVLSEFNIYPNPSSEFIHIEASQRIESVQIVDPKGRIQSTALIDADATTLPISEMTSGIYFVLIHTENGAIKRRIQVID